MAAVRPRAGTVGAGRIRSARGPVERIALPVEPSLPVQLAECDIHFGPAGKGGAAATRMLAQIGELLRTTLDNDASAEIPLSQELAFVEQYLAIEQTRLGDRLCINTAISRETLDAVVPSMLLQPLVENAVRHGVAPVMEGGSIAIESVNRGNRLLMTIRNSGPRSNGNSREAIMPSKGIGLANTAERLKTLYGEDQRLSLRSPESGGYEVTIEIPFRKTVPTTEEALCAR